MRFSKFFACMMGVLSICIFMFSEAAASEKSMESFDTVFDASEFSQVQDVILSDSLLLNDKIFDKNSSGSFDASDLIAYKLYSINTNDFMDTLRVGTNMKEILSKEYVWIVVTPANQVIRVSNEGQSEWQVLGYKEYGDMSVQTDIIQVKSLNDEIENKLSGEAQYVVFFEAAMYHTAFAYIESGEEKYLIPYGSRPELTGLENGKIYSLSEVGDILSQTFDENYTSQENSGLLANENIESQSNTRGTVLIIAGIGILTAGVIVAFAIHKKRLHFPVCRKTC